MVEEKKDGGTAMKDRKMMMIHYWERGENLAVIISLRQNGYSITKVAEIMRISVNTLLAYSKESEKIRKALEFGKIQALSIAEQSLFNQVKQGNMDAIKYYIKANHRSKYDLGATGLDDEMLEEDEGFFEFMAQVYGCDMTDEA